MDPIFNDTSTYEPVHKETHGWSHGGLDGQGAPCHPGSSHASQNAQNGTFSAPYHPNPPSVSETAAPLASFSPPEPSYSAAPGDPASQGLVSASEVDHARNTDRMSDQLNSEQDAGPHTGGVNFQNLLDNLSHPGPGATMPGPATAEASSFYQAPVDESFQSQGVPTHHTHHAQAQSIPSHNTQDNGTYQHPSTHNVNPQAYTSPSNPQTQSQPQSQLYPPAGTAPAGNPIPLTSGVQTPSTGPESQSSQEPLLALKKGRVDKQGRPIKGIDDDSPWGPEVQKKYDEFLHDERIYVTEGLWDRFPMGSRLFVGKYDFSLGFALVLIILLQVIFLPKE